VKCMHGLFSSCIGLYVHTVVDESMIARKRVNVEYMDTIKWNRYLLGKSEKDFRRVRWRKVPTKHSKCSLRSDHVTRSRFVAISSVQEAV
jgi:hypothetical protein